MVEWTDSPLHSEIQFHVIDSLSKLSVKRKKGSILLMRKDALRDTLCDAWSDSSTVKDRKERKWVKHKSQIPLGEPWAFVRNQKGISSCLLFSGISIGQFYCSDLLQLEWCIAMWISNNFLLCLLFISVFV